MPKFFHRDLAPEIEALLSPRADMTEDARARALTSAGFETVWSTETVDVLEALGARLGRIKPSPDGATWPMVRAVRAADGFAFLAHKSDLSAWGTLASILDNGLDGMKQRAEMRQLLITRGRCGGSVAALETVSRLGGRSAVLTYLAAVGDS